MKLGSIIWLFVATIIVIGVLGVVSPNFVFGAQVNHPCSIKKFLPDPHCTPGAVSSAVTQANIKKTICKLGYTAKVRPSVSITNKIKLERMKAYGDTDSPSKYELDHLIPLELGGAPSDVKNLFPESYAGTYGATTKDKLENKLNYLVCGGKMKLTDAQKAIAINWIAAYKKYVVTRIIKSSKTSTGNCCKICITSIACGDTCISKSYICTKPPGCACQG